MQKRCIADTLGISVRTSQAQLNSLISYPKNIGYNASMRRLWGHMTINLYKSVNSMFESTRHLSVSSLVEKTYFKTTKNFAIRG